MRSWMAVLSILAGVGTAGCLFRGDDTDALRQRARQKIVNDPSARAVIEGNNAFALDLFNHLEAAGKGNLVIAPASVSTALAMAWEGARGGTEAEMAKVLRFTEPPEGIHSAFTLLHRTMNTGPATRGSVLHEANRLWAQRGLDFLPRFLSLTRETSGAELAQVDFASQPGEACRAINTWTAAQTEQKIADMISADMLDPTTRLVLTDAVYFKGDWADPFHVENTKTSPFHITPTQDVQVPLMYRMGGYPYAKEDGFALLALPYRGGDLSLLVLLPDATDGLAQLEQRLTADNLNRWLSLLQHQEAQVFMPRFRLASVIRLEDTLRSMGMTSAFAAKQADFSGMNGRHDLFLSAVIQKVFIDVNEKGTEAAAATEVEVKSAGGIGPPQVFRMDHPFLFLLRDNQVGTILFMGCVWNPLS